MSTNPTDPTSHRAPLYRLTLGALGIVFGDIGTSPLYTMRESLAGGVLQPETILGVLSLIFWSLVIVISLKYVTLVMRADNAGEGGMLALVALVTMSNGNRPRPWVLALGMLGAALMFGDGILTPAISVLSAVEGLAVATPELQRFVIPVTIVLLVALLSMQQLGTDRVSKLFGPLMLVWFVTLFALGIRGIAQFPGVLEALNPIWGIRFFADNGLHSFLVLGAVFLAVTGGEALYADMGHLGKTSIRLAWFLVAFPALVTHYFGQGALLLQHPEALHNPFYALAPEWGLFALVVLATAASMVASQAVISGAFSLAHQALQMDFIPRLNVRHSSAAFVGQVYVPVVNWLLLAGAVALVVGFRSSTNLAGAYGVAVSGQMVLTTLLVFLWLRSRAGGPAKWLAYCALLGLLVDLAFLGATSTKIAQGGWITLLIAVVVYLLMSTWRQGRRLLREKLGEPLPVDLFLSSLESSPVKRVPGTAVFMDSRATGVPHVLLHNVKHNKVLHEQVVFLSFRIRQVPRVNPAERVEVVPIAPGFTRVIASWGFMETPSTPQVLEQVERQSALRFKLMDTTFFLGHESVVWGPRSTLRPWRRRIFGWLLRNAQSPAAHFELPPNRVVELGAQVTL